MTKCDFGKIIEKSLNGNNPFFEDQLNEKVQLLTLKN